MLLDTSKIDFHLRKKLGLSETETFTSSEIELYFEAYSSLVDEILLFVGESFSKSQVAGVKRILAVVKDEDAPEVTVGAVLNAIALFLREDPQKAIAFNARISQFIDNFALKKLSIRT